MHKPQHSDVKLSQRRIGKTHIQIFSKLGLNWCFITICFTLLLLEFSGLIHEQPSYDPFFAENPFSPDDEFVFTAPKRAVCKLENGDGQL